MSKLIIERINNFNLQNKKIDYYKNTHLITKINNNCYYGTDGEQPKVEVSNINVFNKNKEITVPSKYFNDIFECTNDLIIKKTQKSHYIVYQWNSDGAGTYLIVWSFLENKLKQRLIIIP